MATHDRMRPRNGPAWTEILTKMVQWNGLGPKIWPKNKLPYELWSSVFESGSHLGHSFCFPFPVSLKIVSILSHKVSFCPTGFLEIELKRTEMMGNYFDDYMGHIHIGETDYFQWLVYYDESYFDLRSNDCQVIQIRFTLTATHQIPCLLPNSENRISAF